MNNIKELLSEFHQIATSPRKQLDKYLKEGKKVIGWMPVYCPTELVSALGMIPFGVWGSDIEVKEAKKYYPAFYCGIAQTALELGITGKLDGLSAIMIPALCDTLKCQGQNWKYAVPNIPMIPVIHPQNRNTTYGKEYLVAKYNKISAELETIAGKKLDNAELKKANENTNRHNAAMRNFALLANDYPNTIDAIVRSEVFKSSYFMEITEHTKLVESLIEALKATAKEASSKKKVIVSGIIADNANLLKIFNDNNLQIVGDDIAYESRQYRTDIPDMDDAMQALAAQFCNRNDCSVLYDVEKHRVEYLLEMAQSTDADGLILILTKFCDPEEFDYVFIKQAFEKAEIPMILVEIDRQMVNFDQIKTAIQTFTDMIE